MVRTSLKCLVNLRTKDIYWWGNGRKLLMRAHDHLIKEKNELDDQVFKSHNSEAAIGDLVGRLSSSDPNKLLESIKSLESLYSQKYDPQTSRKLVKEQMRLFQGADAIEPNVKRAFNEALSKWESP